MRDPMAVAFEIPRLWPRAALWRTEQAARTGVRWQFRESTVLAGRGYYWPPLITVWHRDPSGDDHITCRSLRWRLHVHHWRIQVPALQQLRRRLLTRCSWCRGRHRKGDAVNVSNQWDRSRTRWWKGERGLFHMDCSAIKSAHSTCICERPVLDEGSHGYCARCSRRRSYGITPDRLQLARELAAIPRGARRPPSVDGGEQP